MANTLRGFDVAYKNRGSWRAYRRLKGVIVDEVPVAWDADWSKGNPPNPPSLKIWFEDRYEAQARLDTGKPFVVAVAKKRAGSASSSDIAGLFDVMPVEVIPDEKLPEAGAAEGVLCNVIGQCKQAGSE